MVERMAAGDLAALKETMIAVVVFRRPVAHFDPKLDSIVRVEARRLRARLDAYYRGEGRDVPVRIELPVGSYVPLVRQRPQEQPTSDTLQRALDLVERGEHFLRQALSKQTLETALARFDEALRAEPTLAAACVGMGRAWFNLATGWHHEPAIASEHAAEALRRGLALEPGDAIAHALLGAIEHQLLLARRIDPQYVNSRAHIVNLRIAQGRIDEAGVELEAMRDLAPHSLAANGLAGVLAMAAGDAAGAASIYTALCAVAPDNPGCFACLAGAQAAAGEPALAAATLADMHRRFPDRIISPYVLAIVATHSGHRDDAFAMLERACSERDPSALEMAFDVSFRALHGDPRWPALIAALRTTPARQRARARA